MSRLVSIQAVIDPVSHKGESHFSPLSIFLLPAHLYALPLHLLIYIVASFLLASPKPETPPLPPSRYNLPNMEFELLDGPLPDSATCNLANSGSIPKLLEEVSERLANLSGVHCVEVVGMQEREGRREEGGNVGGAEGRCEFEREGACGERFANNLQTTRFGVDAWMVLLRSGTNTYNFLRCLSLYISEKSKLT